MTEVIGDRYEVIRLLGEGAMGRVVLARDKVLGREVAVKRLRSDMGLPAEAMESLVLRMQNEARAAAALSHPHIVPLFDMGDDGGPFLVFQYVAGPSLRERIAQGPLEPLDVARMAVELGGALAAAHDAGVIHRDVKPENVLIEKTGSKLADFGVARVPDSTLTRAGMPIGTPAYSAPETFKDGTHSALSDQFSLAATLYEALSGKRAFSGEDAVTVAANIATADPAPITQDEDDARRKLMMLRCDAVLSRALSKDPKKRYASCYAFGDALAAAIDARVSGAFSIPPLHHSQSIVPKATRRWQNLAVGLALIVIIVLLIIGRRQHDDGASLQKVSTEFASVVQSAPAPPRAHKPSHAPMVPTASASTDSGPTLPTPVLPASAVFQEIGPTR